MTVVIKDLKIVERRIHHVSPPLRIHSDALGPSEATGRISKFSDFALILAVRSEYLHPAVHGIRHVQRARLVDGEMGREVELAFAETSGSKLLLERPVRAKYANHMLLRISDKNAIRGYRDATRPLKMIGNLEPQLTVFAKGHHLAEDRIRHKEYPIPFCNRDGRQKSHGTNLLPAMPFAGFTIIKTNGIGAGIREAKVFVLIECQPERLPQGARRFAIASEPFSEAREGRRFCAEISGS